MTLRTTINRVLVSACCVSLMGCTTLSPLNLAAPPTTGSDGGRQDGAAVEGDTVLIKTKDGRSFEARLHKLGVTTVELVVRDGGQLVTLQKEEIASVNRKQFSWPRTLLLVAGAVVLIYAYAQIKLLDKVLGTP